MSAQFDGWPHVIKSQQFSRPWMENQLFPQARRMREVLRHKCGNELEGKRMVVLFYQPSTRTRGSFQMAHCHLGGEVSFASENAGEFSSAEKGESLEHTMQVWNAYEPDVMVIRFKKEGDAERAAKISSVPIISAGDGPGQHPTQALLDIFTIIEKLGRVDGVSIAINGDLGNNRTARSLAYLLSKFNDVKIYFVSPHEQKMKEDVLSHLRERNVWFRECEDLREVIDKVDVVYMLRTQREYGDKVYDLTRAFTLDSLMAQKAKEKAIFMHPLPIDDRVREITPEMEKDSRSVFLKDQLKNGLYVRMALLSMILGDGK